MLPRIRGAVAPCLLSLALLHPAGVLAHGAIAIGLPPDVAKTGIAFGLTRNHLSQTEADELALARCREYKEAPGAAALCRIYQSFSRQCVAVALDPQAGTPGWGWAMAPALPAAESQAMAMCRDTAGARGDYCEISLRGCDTTP
jgi:uncharacterized protein DUF4189